jgi:hypothetical protein
MILALLYLNSKLLCVGLGGLYQPREYSSDDVYLYSHGNITTGVVFPYHTLQYCLIKATLAPTNSIVLIYCMTYLSYFHIYFNLTLKCSCNI